MDHDYDITSTFNMVISYIAAAGSQSGLTDDNVKYSSRPMIYETTYLVKMAPTWMLSLTTPLFYVGLDFSATFLAADLFSTCYRYSMQHVRIMTSCIADGM